MRGLKLMSAFFAILALAAVASASASASFPEFSPQSGTFTGTSSTVGLQVKGGGTFTCKKSTSTGELTGAKTGTAEIAFEGCTVAGLSILSLGTVVGKLLILANLSLCQIGVKDVAIDLTVVNSGGVHIEIPTGKHLQLLRGGIITLISPINSSKTGPFPLVITQKEAIQSIEKCEGGAAQKLESSLDGGAFVQTGLEIKEGSLTFAAAHELKD